MGAVWLFRVMINDSRLEIRVRLRVGKILLQLWGHPMGESRKAIVDLVRASLARPQAAAAAPSSSSPSAAASGSNDDNPQQHPDGPDPDPLATDCFKAAFDIITYFFNDAMERLKDGKIEERSNRGRPLEAGHSHWGKYQRDRKQCTGGLRTYVLTTGTEGEGQGLEHDRAGILASYTVTITFGGLCLPACCPGYFT